MDKACILVIEPKVLKILSAVI